MPRCSQLGARLVEHGAVLDTGRTGTLATTAGQAVIEMREKSLVNNELTICHALQQGDSSTR